MKEPYNAGNPEHVKQREIEEEYEMDEHHLDLRNLMRTREGKAYISTLLKHSKIFSNCMNKGNSQGIFDEGWRSFGLDILKGVCEAVPETIPLWMRDMVREQLGVKFAGDKEDG